MRTSHQKWWRAAEMERLQNLRADKVDWIIVAERCGHTIASCKTMLDRLEARRAARALAAATPRQKHAKRPWTEDEIARLIHLREVEGKAWRAIDAELKRSAGGSHVKFDSLRRPQPVSMIEPGARIVVSAAVLADRAARQKLEYDNLTAAFCRDPLPGRSVLDRMRAGVVDPPPPLTDRRSATFRPPVTLATEPFRC